MFAGLLGGWQLRRNPLSPSVPLEGTETVQGLRTLERLHAASLLASGGGAGRAAVAGRAPGPAPPSRRRRYQRYKGPFLEQLSFGDLKKDPRPWRQFVGTAGGTGLISSYSLPASLDLLCERMEENAAFYVTNYLRLILFVLMLTLYLRPAAVIGTVALGVSIAYNLSHALEAQRAAAAGGGTAPPRPAQPPSMLGAGLAAGTWIVVAYTRCIPVIGLGLAMGGASAGWHAALRAAPSEMRHRGRTPISFTFWQVVGREAVPPGANPRALFMELAAAVAGVVARQAAAARRWAKYYALTAWDAVRRPFVPALRSGGAWT